MLNKIIKIEEERFKIKLNPFSTIPIKYFEDLIKNYNIHEFTIHWYDGSSPKCYECLNHGEHFEYCKNCEIKKNWIGSFEQLTYNNWIDVYGPGIWGASLEESNEQVKNIFNEEILLDDEFEKRIFWCYQKKYFDIYYLNRDRKSYDYWFMFTRAPGRE